MATTKQRQTARENVKKAQSRWEGMDRRQRAKSQPEGRARAKIGTKGEGEFYRIEVRDKKEFKTFRYHDVGSKGHLMRLSGQRPTGSWGTAAWLVEKDDAHVQGTTLVPDTRDARELFNKLGSPPKRIRGDIFAAMDRRNSTTRKIASGTSSRSSRSTSSSSRKSGTTSRRTTSNRTGSTSRNGSSSRSKRT
jgi:hypothetical protein